MEKRLKLYLADIEDKEDGLLRLSLVKRPATGCACKVLSVGDKYVRVFAPIIVANKPIYRKDGNLGEYNLLFLPDVIKDIQTRTAIENPRIKFDVEHDGHDVEGVVVVSSFIIDHTTDTLYSNYYGLPDGSWVMELLIERNLYTKLDQEDARNRLEVNNLHKRIDVTKSNIKSSVKEKENMVNGTNPARSTSHDFFGISISGVFTYSEVSLSDAIDIYNKIRY